MCWISVKTESPPNGTRIDLWERGFGRRADIEILDGNTVVAFGLFGEQGWIGNLSSGDYTHWRYPPAPPEGM